ncbi:MAG: hypothetical protein KIT83_02840 [Bryobacterales bacterium]|nr:hypothetical protein [Bryobacterales bacterium]
MPQEPTTNGRLRVALRRGGHFQAELATSVRPLPMAATRPNQVKGRSCVDVISGSSLRAGTIAVAFVVLLAALASECAASESAPVQQRPVAAINAVCACPEPSDTEPMPGVVWQGTPSSVPDLSGIAHLLAPVLWFSSDEPLILRNGAPVPQAHPSDVPSESAVVYYQVADVVLRGDEPYHGQGEQGAQFFDKVAQLRIKYFFYYDEDFGLKPHRHDLEVVVMRVHLEKTGDGCRRVRVDRIEGLAHGLDWYSNILRIERDVVLPITILVEEGKHASVPDRNGDGVYTPGYDANVRINDAWGLRDVLGSSVLMGSRYQSSMSKPRNEAFRLYPPENLELCGRQRSRSTTNLPQLGRYELRPASNVPGGMPPAPEAARLYEMMRFHQFGPEWPLQQHSSSQAQALSDPENIYRFVSGFNLRWDTNRIGGTLQGPGLDLREVWVVPRALLMEGWGVEALVTPSASRWVDWYASGGYERGITRNPDRREGEPLHFNGFASELGLKFRLTLPGRARWAALGYRFSGLRIGIRTSGFTQIREPRFVIEIGAGAF